MNNNNSIVTNILGIFSDLQTKTLRCEKCSNKAEYSDLPRVYSMDRKTKSRTLLCKEHAKETGIDMDDEELEEDYLDEE